MLKKVLVVVFILNIQLAWAAKTYTIKGAVVDKENGETIIGANVHIKELDIGTTTNKFGFFTLSAPEGHYTAVISYLGYESHILTISLFQHLTHEIELMKSTRNLEEVVVIADKERFDLVQSPQLGGAKQLESRTFSRIPSILGEVDILRSIQLLPGVTNNGDVSTGLHVRGGGVDQNLVLLDESIIYGTTHLLGLLSVFNPDVIKKVELYDGRIHTKYGGRISSVLDITQKDGNRKQFQLSGGIGLLTSRLTAETPIMNGRGSLLIGGRTSYLHLFTPLIEQLENDKLYFNDLNFKASYSINNSNRIFVSGYLGRDRIKIDRVSENNYGNTIASIRWNHHFGPKLFSNLSFNYGKYDYQVIIDHEKLDWVADIKHVQGKYDFNYYIKDNLQFDFGVSSLFYDIFPGAVKPTEPSSSYNHISLPNKQAFESAIYGYVEQELTNRLSLSYGLRLSFFNRKGGAPIPKYLNDQPVVYNETIGIYEEGTVIEEQEYDQSTTVRSFQNLEPRINLSYLLREESYLRISYMRTAQYIHLISNSQNVNPIDIWTPSGKYIEPQLSNQYSLGFYHRLRKGFELDVETYYKKGRNRLNYIDQATLVGQRDLERETLAGKSRAYGIEFLLSRQNKQWSGWLAYTLSRSEQKTGPGNAGGPGINDGKWYKTINDRTHDIGLNMAYTVNDKWSIGANIVYQTGRPVTYPNGQYEYGGLVFSSFADRNAERLPTYHRMDISATFVPNKHPERRWQGEWVFGIYNLYGRHNAWTIAFDTNEQTGQNMAEKMYIYGAPVPSVTYNFKLK